MASRIWGAGVEPTVAEARTKNARSNVGTTIVISSSGLEYRTVWYSTCAADDGGHVRALFCPARFGPGRPFPLLARRIFREGLWQMWNCDSSTVLEYTTVLQANLRVIGFTYGAFDSCDAILKASRIQPTIMCDGKPRTFPSAQNATFPPPPSMPAVLPNGRAFQTQRGRECVPLPVKN